MKALMLLSTILLLGACAGTPTVKSVVGEYEFIREDEVPLRVVLLEDGAAEIYVNDKKTVYEDEAWKMVNGEIHIGG